MKPSTKNDLNMILIKEKHKKFTKQTKTKHKNTKILFKAQGVVSVIRK